MILAVVLALWVLIPLLGLMTFVQVLYLESLRLRTRDLPSLKFFKETLEDRIGIPTEDGAGAFSLVKHTLLSIVGRSDQPPSARCSARRSFIARRFAACSRSAHARPSTFQLTSSVLRAGSFAIQDDASCTAFS